MRHDSSRIPRRDAARLIPSRSIGLNPSTLTMAIGNLPVRSRVTAERAVDSRMEQRHGHLKRSARPRHIGRHAVGALRVERTEWSQP